MSENEMPAGGSIEYTWVHEYRVMSRMQPGRDGRPDPQWRKTPVEATRSREKAKAEMDRRIGYQGMVEREGYGWLWALPENNRIEVRLAPVFRHGLPQPSEWEAEER